MPRTVKPKQEPTPKAVVGTPRKVAQIVCCPGDDVHIPHAVVLCNDGTMWRTVVNWTGRSVGEISWVQLPDIPPAQG